MLVDWIKVKKGSPMDARSVEEAQTSIPEGVSIVGIMRDKDILPKPEDDFIIQAGDTLLVVGKKDIIGRFEEVCKAKG